MERQIFFFYPRYKTGKSKNLRKIHWPTDKILTKKTALLIQKEIIDNVISPLILPLIHRDIFFLLSNTHKAHFFKN